MLLLTFTVFEIKYNFLVDERAIIFEVRSQIVVYQTGRGADGRNVFQDEMDYD